MTPAPKPTAQRPTETMKKTNTINAILAAAVVALAAMCVMSVYAPIRFDRQRELREQAVRHRLGLIRDAAERYRSLKGAYTGQLNELVRLHLLADSLQYIPYSARKRFHMQASTVTARSGRQTPVMECSTTYDEYLQGLDPNRIHNLAAQAQAEGRFPGLKIGDIETPGDNRGNWE